MQSHESSSALRFLSAQCIARPLTQEATEMNCDWDDRTIWIGDNLRNIQGCTKVIGTDHPPPLGASICWGVFFIS